MLRVIPQRGDGIAVEVPHHQALVLAVGELRGAKAVFADADAGRKHVHQPLVEGFLLVAVIVILIAGRRLRAIEPKRVDRIAPIGRVASIGIVGEQGAFRLVPRPACPAR